MRRLMPEPWERARMALAEVGGPVECVIPPVTDGAAFTFKFPLAADVELCWRTRAVALPHSPLCFQCMTDCAALGWDDITARRARRQKCEAIRPFEQDCGVIR